MIKYTVSIFILTYNQEQFIAQTIASILMQKTNFTFQLVIGEDCSTDATLTICEGYAAQYPDKIKLIPSQEKNIGLIANYKRTFAACDGKYIAICDGDDYWIDDYKLQKQVDFLEANPDYSIVYSNVAKLYPDGTIKNSKIQHPRQGADFTDLIKDNFIPSVTVLFRNKQSYMEFPNWITLFPYGDWPTYLWTIAEGGKIHFSNDITAVYRMEIGVSAPISKTNSKLVSVNLGILNQMIQDVHFSGRKDIIQKEIIQKKNSLMLSYNREGEYLKGIKQFVINLNENSDIYGLCKLYCFSMYKKMKR